MILLNKTVHIFWISFMQELSQN